MISIKTQGENLRGSSEISQAVVNAWRGGLVWKGTGCLEASGLLLRLTFSLCSTSLVLAAAIPSVEDPLPSRGTGRGWQNVEELQLDGWELGHWSQISGRDNWDSRLPLLPQSAP